MVFYDGLLLYHYCGLVAEIKSNSIQLSILWLIAIAANGIVKNIKIPENMHMGWKNAAY